MRCGIPDGIDKFDKMEKIIKNKDIFYNKLLEDKNKELYEELRVTTNLLINCQKALDINKEIMRNALVEQNRVQEEYGKDIQKLQDKIKKLEQKG